MMHTDEDLIRERLQALSDPGPLDADLVVAGSVRRSQRRSLLTASGAGAAVLGASGLAWMLGDSRSGRPANPGTAPVPPESSMSSMSSAPPSVMTGSAESPLPSDTPNPNAPIPTTVAAVPLVEPWPTTGGPKAGTLHRLSGNLALQVNNQLWAVWDTQQGMLIKSGDWISESIGSMVINRVVWGNTDSRDGRNYFAVVLPIPLHRAALKLGSSTVPITTRALSPVVPRGSVLSWSEQPGTIESTGDFVLSVQVTASAPVETIRIRV